MPPPIRARDLRANIKEMGFDKGVVATVERFLDEYAGHRQHIRELTDLVSQCIDQVERLATVSTTLKDHIDTIRREEKQQDAS